jgi:site-specific recombinase XerD
LRTWFDDEDNKDFKQYKFNLNFRLLRHTYCTGLYDAGIDELSAAEIMGHDVIIMRSIYTHIQEARKHKTITKLDTIYKK